MTKTLYDAVSDTMSGFEIINRAFSAHDITTTLRNLTNAGKLEIRDASKVTANGTSMSEVDHDAVRTIVRDIYRRDVLANMTCNVGDFSFVVYYFMNHNYDPTNYSRIPLLGSDFPDKVIPVTKGRTTITTAVRVSSINSDIGSKIEVYISNQHSDGISPSLKRIQSRLKSFPGITVKMIGQYVQDEITGCKLNEVGSAYSKSTVEKS